MPDAPMTIVASYRLVVDALRRPRRNNWMRPIAVGTVRQALALDTWRRQPFEQQGIERVIYTDYVASPDGTLCVWRDVRPLPCDASAADAHAAAVAAGRVFLRVYMPDTLRGLLHCPPAAWSYCVDELGWYGLEQFADRAAVVAWMFANAQTVAT